MSKKDEYARKQLGYKPASAEGAKERGAGLPGDVVHLQARPNAEDWSEVQHNISGATPTSDCQQEGSTGKRVVTQQKDTEGYRTSQKKAHEGPTNADGVNPTPPVHSRRK